MKSKVILTDRKKRKIFLKRILANFKVLSFPFVLKYHRADALEKPNIMSRRNE